MHSFVVSSALERFSLEMHKVFAKPSWFLEALREHKDLRERVEVVDVDLVDFDFRDDYLRVHDAQLLRHVKKTYGDLLDVIKIQVLQAKKIVELADRHKQITTAAIPPDLWAGRSSTRGLSLFSMSAYIASTLRGRGRVAIVSLDLHYARGVHDIIESLDNVLYVAVYSTNVIQRSLMRMCAERPWRLLAVPMPPGSIDDHYVSAIEIVCKVLERYCPSSIIVLLGFDSHRQDFTGDLRLTYDVYHDVGLRLADLAERLGATLITEIECSNMKHVAQRCFANYISGTLRLSKIFRDSERPSSCKLLDEEISRRLGMVRRILFKHWSLSI